MTWLFLAAMFALGLVIGRWWAIGAAVITAIALAWLYDATQLHAALEPSLHFLIWLVAAVAAGVAAGIGVFVRRFLVQRYIHRA